jgi:hypothetical protein
MIYKKLSLPLALLSATLLLTSCGGGSGGDGSTITGGNGSAPSVSARTTPINVGDIDCPNGGVLVESGIDENLNGLLDDIEVDDSQKVCNGLNSHNSLITLNQEAAGANCPYGGIRIDSGLDINDNGILDAGEIDNNEYVCNLIDGSVGWQVATLVELSNAGNARDPQISFNSNSNAHAVWSLIGNIWSNQYVANEGWGRPVLLESNDTGEAIEPQISTDNQGNALAVWSQWDGNRYTIWSNRFVLASGWGTAEQINVVINGGASSPQIKLDDSGNGIAVWQQNDGPITNVWSNRYAADTGWGSAEIIGTTGIGWNANPQLDFDANGNAIAVWQYLDSSSYDIWSNRYIAGTGWGTAEAIDANDAQDAQSPQVTVDENGSAMAVWTQNAGNGNVNIWSSHFTNGIGWASAELVETIAGVASNPQIDLDDNGNAVAVWQQYDGTINNIWANHYIAGVDWGSAELIETENAGSATNPQVQVDEVGNALAVWVQFDGLRRNIWSNRYNFGVGWSHADLIETDNTGGASDDPQIGVSPGGSALAIWSQSDGTRGNIWSNIWLAP